jgi:hypothetical protein
MIMILKIVIIIIYNIVINIKSIIPLMEQKYLFSILSTLFVKLLSS